MKIKCEILEVSTDGESLRVTLQGASDNDPEWYGWKRQEIRIRNTAPVRRAFHVGRRVEIIVATVKAR